MNEEEMELDLAILAGDAPAGSAPGLEAGQAAGRQDTGPPGLDASASAAAAAEEAALVEQERRQRERELAAAAAAVGGGAASRRRPRIRRLKKSDLVEGKGKKGKVRVDATLRLLLLGDTAVGKTSLLNRFSQNKFSNALVTTTGVAFHTEYLEIDGRRVRVDLWDTAGQEKFHVITRSYYGEADGIVLVYDCSEGPDGSFQSVGNWVSNIRDQCKESCVLMLLGNKVDAPEKRISTAQGQAAADTAGFSFMETSAKTGLNVKEALHTVAREATTRYFQRKAARAGACEVEEDDGDASAAMTPEQLAEAAEKDKRKCVIM